MFHAFRSGRTSCAALARALGACLLWGCGGGESADIEVLSATPEQCPEGGLALLVDGEPQGVVCNGEPGPPGERGRTGAVGPQGEPAPATEGGPIRGTLYCSLNDGQLFLEVYLWITGAPEEPFNNVGVCRLGGPSGSDTVALIGVRCSLLSGTPGDVVEVQVGANLDSATATGPLAGALECGR